MNQAKIWRYGITKSFANWAKYSKHMPFSCSKDNIFLLVYYPNRFAVIFLIEEINGS